MLNQSNVITRPHCGEIWMCRLNNNSGSVQNGYRPVLIMSNNKNNTHSTTINVIPLTSKMNKRGLPIHVELKNYQKYGLKSPSTLMIEQITTVDINHLQKFVGKITDKETIKNISNALTVQFPFLIGCVVGN